MSVLETPVTQAGTEVHVVQPESPVVPAGSEVPAGNTNAGRAENRVAELAKADDGLNLEAIGRKVIALDKQSYAKEVSEAKATAGIIDLIASLIPISKRLKLKVVAGWIREARKGQHNYASTTTILQDPTKATAPERHKQGSDNYRQLAYRRMNLARITAAVQGRLSPTGKSLWRKGESPENLTIEHEGQKHHGVTIVDGAEVICYATPVDMLKDGYALTTVLRMWMDALRPKVVNLRDRAEKPTVSQIKDMVEGLKVPAKVQETTKDGEIIEKSKSVKVMSDATLLADAIIEMLNKAKEFQYGVSWQEDGRLALMKALCEDLASQQPIVSA